MANIVNQYGQVKLGVRYTSAPLTSTLWGNVFGVWNADALGTSLDTSIYGVYNGDNVNDTSGNARNGTNVNNVTFTTGKVGNAFTFNGSGYVSLPNNSLNFPSTDFTISAWVNLTDITNIQSILHNYTEVITDFRGFFLIVANSRIYFRIDNGDIISNDLTSTSITTNTWTHIVITRKASTRSRMYVNGILVASDTSTVNPTFFPTMSNNYIGAYRDSNGFRYISNGGKVDAVNVWTKELTAGEIINLYNGNTGAEYPFSSQTLATYNDAVGTNHGTTPASTNTNGVPGPAFTTGKIGKAFQFDGINDYISLGDNKFNFAGNFSISCWINLNSVSGNQCIFSNLSYDSSNFSNGWFLLMRNNKLYFEFYKNNGTYDYIASNTNLSTSTWYHINIVRVASQSTKIYINGALDTSNTSAYNPTYTSSIPIPSSIGGWKYNASTVIMYMNGKIDALNIWNRELTATEITELYNSGNGKQYPN